jgi:Beta-propeller repeat
MSSTNLRVETLEARDVPAGDLAYALQLTGLPATAVTRVAADPVGNLYVTGTFSGTVDLDPTTAGASNVVSKGGTDLFVAKYGFNGQLVWARSLGGTGNDSAADIAFDGAGNVYVAGTFAGAVDFDPTPQLATTLTAPAAGSAFVWKLDFEGDLFLARSVTGTSSASSLAIDPLGNIFVTGQFKGTADFDPDPQIANTLTTTNPAGSAYVWRLNSTGAFAWARAYNTTGSIETTAIAVDGAGNVYTAGRTTGTADLDPAAATKAEIVAGSSWVPFVSKLGFSGGHVWAQSPRVVTAMLGAPNRITGLGIDSIGNVYAAGTFAGTLDFNPDPKVDVSLTSTAGSVDGFAWKLGVLGGLQWARSFGGATTETVADVSVDKAGNAYLAGTFTGTVDFDPNAGVVNLVSGSGTSAAYVMKLAPGGALGYGRSLGGGTSTARGTGVWADGAGNIYVSGGFSGTADLDPAAAVSSLNGGTGSGFVAKLMPAYDPTPAPVNTPPARQSAGGPYVITEGQGLSLSASATDFNQDTLVFSWDLNADGTFGDATGARPVLTPAQMVTLGLNDSRLGLIPVRVRIADGVNLPVEALTTLTIKNQAPIATVTAPAKVIEGSTPRVAVSSVQDPSTADRAAGFRYSYDLNNDGQWEIGNGMTYGGSVTATTAAVPAGFTAGSGPLQVRVRVFDKDGGFSDRVAQILIQNLAPRATFAAVGVPTVGNPVVFRFTNPQDARPDVVAGFTYGFDFNNDGVFEVAGKSPQATHIFPARGSYVVRGAIADRDGAITVYTLTVNLFKG